MNQQVPNRILGADTIRALATLWVFAGHLFVLEPTLKAIDAPALRVLNAGYMGVAAFFVLSGFLLSMPFWRSYRSGAGLPNLKTYARRRLTRIVPEYVVCVLVLAVIAGALTSKWGLIQVAGCLTFTNTLLPATYMPTWNPPLWSISIEMAFYLMLPLVAVCMLRLRSVMGARVCVVALMALIALAQPILLWAAPWLEQTLGNESFFNAASSATTKNAVVLFSHFLIGVIAADIYLSRSPRLTGRRFNRYDLLVLAAAATIIGSLATATALPGLGYMHYQWPTFPALIGLLLVCLPRSAVLGPWIEGRFIRSTATLSYGLYIWHIPILYGLKHVWPTTSDGRISLVAVYALAALACSYTAAAISYRLVGKPALDCMRARETKSSAPTTVAAMPCKAAA